MSENHPVAVVGAGPAGMFAARELARAGAQVAIFNRDIKPGGLAEYGIYPDKYAMKQGLRNQFQQVLDTPGITYYGNLSVGAAGDLTLADLRACGFQAILVTVGAQGTKWLGLPGENLPGVYHAKDLVYHYNQLPPYSQHKFEFGRRVAVVGAGNVMLDIARFLMQKVKVDEVIAVVRRGPAEVKFDKKEMEYVAAHLDVRALDDELARVSGVMQAIGQNPAEARAMILEALPKAQPALSPARFRFSFLASPAAILSEAEGRVSGLEVEETSLSLKDGEVKARGSGIKRVIPADAVVFAIGDRVDESFGLPTQGAEFAKNPQPRFAVDGLSYEAFDPQNNTVIADTFVAGWSRQASTGLVGYARKDGTNGAKAVLQYLATLPAADLNAEKLNALLRASGKTIISRGDVRKLVEIENAEAQRRGLEFFKFSTNEQMLAKIMSVG
ncbi:MAG: FAD-dependent oxidoreductase [Anaerolineales bacterium]